MTFRQLACGAQRCGLELREHARPAIVLDASMGSLTAVLGALLAPGRREIGVFDAAMSRQRLDRLLGHFNPDAVIGPAEVLARLDGARPHVPLPETIAPSRDVDVRPVEASAWDNVLVLFTSGSEGGPKGVRHSLRTLVPALRNQAAAMDLRDGHTQLLTTSPAHVIGLLGLLRSLFFETTLCLGGGSDVAETVELVRRECVDHLHTVPTWWRAFLREWRRSGEEVLPFHSVLLSGEPVRARDYSATVGLLASQSRFIVGLGATEAPTFCFEHWTGPELEGEATIPVGRAAAGRAIRVAGPTGETVPAGEIGDVIVSGDELWLGYDGEAVERTAVHSEFRTGDVGRIDAEGRLHVLGRSDRLVKVAGHRVNPVDLERAIAAYPGIADACCILHRSSASPRLLAGYTTHPGATPDLDRMKAFLAEQLEPELLPEALVRLDALPRTPSGKADWQRVEALILGAMEARVARGVPTSSIYTRIQSLWTELVPGARGAPDDNFYRLGGDSLLAARLCFALEAAFEIRLPLTVLLQYPGLDELAAYVETRLATRAAAPAPTTVTESTPVAQDARNQRADLTPGQRIIWLDHHRVGGGALYHLIADYEIHGSLDAVALQRALDCVVDGHEAFRRWFSVADGRPFQSTAASARLPLRRLELPADDASPARVRALLEKIGRAPFDLEQPPLARAALASVSPEHHYFVLVFHHLIIDGNAFDRLYRDLEQAYGAAMAGDGPLPRLATDFNYLNYVQRAAARTSEIRERALDFWREQLHDPPEDGAAAGLIGGAVDDGADFRGEDVWFRLPASLVRSLDSAARALETTRYVVLLASYQVAWMRFTGRTDNIVGAPYSGRIEPDLLDPIGFFVNTLPIRTTLRREMRFDALVAELKRITTDVLDLQAYPGTDLATDLGLPVTPLYRQLFALQPDRRGLRLGSAECQRFGVTTGTSKVDLAFLVFPVDDTLEVLCEYRTAALSAAWIDSFFASWRVLLEQALAAPATRVGALPMMAAETREQLDRWSGTAHARARFPESLPDLVERWAHATPERVAARDPTGRIVTYGQLWAASGAVAQALQCRGVGRGQRVGYSVDRSADTAALLLGILRAGAAYVPLTLNESTFGQDAIRASALDLIVASHDRQDLARGVSHGAIVAPEELWAVNDRHREPVAIAPDDLACVFVTSGTTGRPKGARIAHRGIVRLVKAPAFAHYDQETVQLQLAPITFDASTLEIWGPLANGGTVVFAPEGALAVADIGRLIEQERINTLWLTAGLFHLFADVEQPWLRGLHTLIAGGDVLSPNKAKQIHERYPHIQLVNGYGPTENTTFSCCHSLRPTDFTGAPIPLGTPIRGTEVHVLGPANERLPAGCIGEICVGGDGLFLGYLDDRDADDPGRWVARPGGHDLLYRTGDYGSWNADGTLAFAGRRDRQVKVRGFRVELDAVERTLAALPGVAQLAVELDRSDSLHPRVVAHYVAKPEGAADERFLVRAARGLLPAHALPARFVEHPSLPLTPEGKVDRRALGHVAGAVPTASMDADAIGIYERRIAAVWQDLLRVPVNAQSDFFALGGDSLLALRAVMELEARLKLPVSLSLLFRTRTPRDLASQLVQRETVPDFRHLVPLRVAEGPAGTAIFFIHGMPASLLSLVPLAMKLPPHIPVYGLQGDSSAARGRDFIDIAGEYVREIRRFQPTGPYLVVGYSLGGLFAHEVARQLALSGKEMERLFLIDAHPSNLPPLLEWTIKLSHRTLAMLRNPSTLIVFARRQFGKAARVVAPAARVRTSPASPTVEMKRRHRPQPYRGRATIFTANRKSLASVIGWRYLVRGPIEVKRLPGTHGSVVRDGLAAIAATLAAYYDRHVPAGNDRGDTD